MCKLKSDSGNMNKKNNGGFTLFELLVSISIIGILTALAVVSFSAAQKRARDARRIEDMGIVQKAAEQYYSQNSYNYPANTSPWTGVLEAFPIDPKGTGWTGYRYYLGAGTTYCACAAMENPANGNSTSNNCVFGTGVTGPFYCVRSQQ